MNDERKERGTDPSDKTDLSETSFRGKPLPTPTPETVPQPLATDWAGLEALVARLRSETGCPWDRKQSLDSLKKHLVEETCEVLDAIDSGSPDHHAEELGDVLLQVVLQAQIRKEEGRFTLNDVVRGLCEKLLRRHPHVFGDASAATPQEALNHWRRVKALEKTADSPAPSVTDRAPRCLPALQRAQKVQEQAATVGFDWETSDAVMRKVREETDELDHALAERNRAAIREEIGDLLFAVVNLSRFTDFDAEDALRAATAKFIRRFKGVEQRAEHAGKPLASCSAEEMDAHWNAVKEKEKAS